MGYKKLGDAFLEELNKDDFSSRVSYKIEKFTKELNDVKTKEELDEVLDSHSLLKGLLKKEGVLNSEFDKIINNISKKL